MGGEPMTAAYDELGFIYRGRLIAPDPGSMPDDLWSCPECAVPVIGTDRVTHLAWHERQNERFSYLDERLSYVEGA
ncbi:hypothetical protein [Pseudonocardia sp. NPDC049154]|uniref:hypothetical protein n=1 Tax=Pseudonocardia sp. NPDC049154 TaxID=3155501 RepID=UPI0034011B2F